MSVEYSRHQLQLVAAFLRRETDVFAIVAGRIHVQPFGREA
jgi:hypothetical protein